MMRNSFLLFSTINRAIIFYFSVHIIDAIKISLLKLVNNLSCSSKTINEKLGKFYWKAN